MPIYTFILEFEGTTSISQFEAIEPVAALVAWAKAFSFDEIPNTDAAFRDELVKEIKQDIEEVFFPTPIDGVRNIWCVSALPQARSLLLNIVATLPLLPPPSEI